MTMDVKPRHSSLPYTLDLEHVTNANIWPMKQWCWDTLGPRWGLVQEKNSSRDGVWTVLWTGLENGHRGSYRWHFKNERDMLMFTLRWM
jgi:hypothetical protein